MYGQELGHSEIKLRIEFMNNLKSDGQGDVIEEQDDKTIRTLPHMTNGKRRMEKLKTQMSASSTPVVTDVVIVGGVDLEVCMLPSNDLRVTG